MRIVAIAAVADNWVIGSGEDMLWHIPEDFRRFKKVTTGNTLIFGRRTLPGRLDRHRQSGDLSRGDPQPANGVVALIA